MKAPCRGSKTRLEVIHVYKFFLFLFSSTNRHQWDASKMSKRHENERSCSWLIVHCSVTFLVLVTILDFLFARLWVYSLFIAILFFHNPVLIGAILR